MEYDKAMIKAIKTAINILKFDIIKKMDKLDELIDEINES